jgi:hypothetical protein
MAAFINPEYGFISWKDLLKSPLRPPFSKGGTGGFADALRKRKMLRNGVSFFK